MDTVPKIIACLFLFRTLKTPILCISSELTKSQVPILTLCFFLLGEMGIWSIPKILPTLLSLAWSGQNLNDIKDFLLRKPLTSTVKESFVMIKNTRSFLIPTVIASVAFLTGWSVADESQLILPVDYFLNNPGRVLFFLLANTYVTIYNKFIAVILHLFYLSLFMSVTHLSYVFLFIFTIIGLLTRNNTFLSLYLVESVLTVGTLFTSAPTNLLFSISSLLLVWQLAKINDKMRLSTN